MSTQFDDDQTIHCDKEQFQRSLPHHYRSILIDFQKNVRSFLHFNWLFFSLVAVEIAFSVPLLNEPIFFAVILAAFSLTIFSYLILLFYFQARKPEQMQALLHRFIASCRMSLKLSQGEPLHSLSVAETLLKLTHYLEDHEWRLIKTPVLLAPISRFVSRFSAYCYWHDVFRFKQCLLYAAIDEHLQQIRLTPTDLEVHASLASTYVALSQIYKEPAVKNDLHPRTNIYKKHAEQFDARYKTAAKLAIEEFQILNHYAPNDPWIHEQLAAGYQQLGLYAEEIREMELLVTLRPHDREVLLRLGALYFQQGSNAKGLQIYEALKNSHFKKAEDLISTYGIACPSANQLIPLNL